jgi:hypothetical protein
MVNVYDIRASKNSVFSHRVNVSSLAVKEKILKGSCDYVCN